MVFLHKFYPFLELLANIHTTISNVQKSMIYYIPHHGPDHDVYAVSNSWECGSSIARGGWDKKRMSYYYIKSDVWIYKSNFIQNVVLYNNQIV